MRCSSTKWCSIGVIVLVTAFYIGCTNALSVSSIFKKAAFNWKSNNSPNKKPKEGGAVTDVNATTKKPQKPIPALKSGEQDVILPIPPRYMWGWGPGLHGYCGETSFQTHGIYYGNWISSEEVRYASGGEELLIAANDELAATTLHYTFESWNWAEEDFPQSSNFLNKFIKGHIDDGHLVAIGLYEVLPRGDKDYDHIVPVIGYRWDSSKNKVKGIFFNDLYLNETRYTDNVANRQGCKTKNEPKQPYDYCIPEDVDYGIALTGVQDEKSELVRMTLVMPSWTEPDWGTEDDLHQPAVPFSVTGTFSGLVSGEKYAILRFDDKDALPSSNFYAGSWAKKIEFTAPGSTHVIKDFDWFQSDATVYYRTVRI